MNDQGSKNSLPIIDLSQDDDRLKETIYRAILATGKNDVALAVQLGISRNTLREIKAGKGAQLNRYLRMLKKLGYIFILPLDDPSFEYRRMPKIDSKFEYRQIPIAVASTVPEPAPGSFEVIRRNKASLEKAGWEITEIRRHSNGDDTHCFTLHTRRRMPVSLTNGQLENTPAELVS